MHDNSDDCVDHRSHLVSIERSCPALVWIKETIGYTGAHHLSDVDYGDNDGNGDGDGDDDDVDGDDDDDGADAGADADDDEADDAVVDDDDAELAGIAGWAH